ncbi:MAG TPA: GNAT family N-acetyltransferase, partial [Blastocatellia bacterium]|nr:GNAT family N-acetyltransferase [Blastocatellia bacterium]
AKAEDAPIPLRGSRAIYQINPLTDPRWNRFLGRNPRASVFHSAPWLEALSRTYGYRPVAYTTSDAHSELGNALVFCRVDSWLTGRRLVSLPFSDCCDLLVSDLYELRRLLVDLEDQARREKWRYLEIRPLDSLVASEATTLSCSIQEYTYHRLDLSPDLDTLFRNFHKNSIQRKVRRAERERVQYREGRLDLLDDFYRLLVITRRRHHVPPQPISWYQNLIACFRDALKIRLAFKNDRAIAGMLTLQYKDTMTYKYGGSDPDYNKFGSMHLLFWKAIQEAKNSRLGVFDFGRTDADQHGLIIFKGRWGATQSRLTYSRYVLPGMAPGFLDPATGKDWKTQLAKRLFARMPSSLLAAIGDKLYRHIG